MVTVKPGDAVTQNRGDVVVYQLPFVDWSADLKRPDDKDAKVVLLTQLGDPLTMRVMPYTPGRQVQEVRISGGSGRKRGQYKVVRTVKSADETRVRSFSLTVNP